MYGRDNFTQFLGGKKGNYHCGSVIKKKQEGIQSSTFFPIRKKHQNFGDKKKKKRMQTKLKLPKFTHQFLGKAKAEQRTWIIKQMIETSYNLELKVEQGKIPIL